MLSFLLPDLGKILPTEKPGSFLSSRASEVQFVSTITGWLESQWLNASKFRSFL